MSNKEMKKRDRTDNVIIKKLQMNKKRLIFVLSIVVLIIINGVISLTTGVNVLNNTVNLVINKMEPNNKEVKSVGLTSDSYQSNEGGSYDIKKSAEWIGTNTAQVKFNVDTHMKTDGKYKDVILVLDISESMAGEKLTKVKRDTEALIEHLLSIQENRVALITFDSKSSIEYYLTNDKEELLTKIESLTDTGFTNYNQALKNVDKVLEHYEKKDNRDLIVLFLTDGYSNVEAPNQVARYELLKEKYPYITINGIQYEMGTSIIDDVEEISDNQYIASKNTLNNILFDAAYAPEVYEKFELIDYIDDDFFYVESINDIKVSMGKVTLTEENGIQKVIWTAETNEFRTGSCADMTINLKLKEQYVGNEGYYPTNKKFEVTTKLPDEKEKTNTVKETPVLKNSYNVIYDINVPDGCNLESIPKEKHFVYENVEKKQTKLSCSGYIFKGWEIIDVVDKVNDDVFVMPSQDVTIKAIWTKQEIVKSMQGTVYKGPTLYEKISEQSVLDNIPSKYVTGIAGIDFSEISSVRNGKGVYTLSSTIGEKYPIHYYRGDVDDNNVIFANYCWKIVRTTETGGVKLIYNGVPNNGTCNNTGEDSQIGKSEFNSLDLLESSPAYNSFMYGEVNAAISQNMSRTNYKYGNDVKYEDGVYKLVDTMDSSNWSTDYKTLASRYHYTCLDEAEECTTIYYVYYMDTYSAHYITLSDGKTLKEALDEILFESTNTTDSTIKEEIDKWYKANMTQYTQSLEDTMWCNDRTVSELGGWRKDGDAEEYMYFSSRKRARETYQPSLSCANKNDAFTVSKENGNGALTYPVGLLTSDEVMYAGGNASTTNTSYYLYTGQEYWTLSPFYFVSTNSSGFIVYSTGRLHFKSVADSYGLRSAISLKPNTHYSGGDGTSNNPYIIINKD